jgi:hypothetical protein
MKDNMELVYESNTSSGFMDFIHSILVPNRVAIRGDKSVNSESSLREINDFFGCDENFVVYKQKQEKTVKNLSLLNAIVVASDKQKELGVVCFVHVPGSIERKMTLEFLNKNLTEQRITTGYKYWEVSWYE